MLFQISFDPKKDSAADVQVAVLRQYAVVSGAALADAVEQDDPTDTAADTNTTHDKEGMPWDTRIHSTPAKLTSKGVWRGKRGVQDTLVASVTAELRAAGKIVQPGSTQSTPVTAGTQGAIPGLAAPAPQQGLPGLAPFTPPAAPDNGYAALVKMVMDNHVSSGGRIDDAWLAQALGPQGLNVPNGQITSLQPAPAESVKTVYNAIAGVLGIAQLP